jgi:hypothetical protein
VPERICVPILLNRLVLERIGFLICITLVPKRIGVLIICDRLVHVRINVLNCDRWFPVVEILSWLSLISTVKEFSSVNFGSLEGMVMYPTVYRGIKK